MESYMAYGARQPLTITSALLVIRWFRFIIRCDLYCTSAITSHVRCQSSLIPVQSVVTLRFFFNVVTPRLSDAVYILTPSCPLPAFLNNSYHLISLTTLLPFINGTLKKRCLHGITGPVTRLLRLKR